MTEPAYKAEAPDTAPAGHKPLTRSEAARHASLVRWKKEQPFGDRLARIRALRAKKKKGGKGKGNAPAKTPEQRMAEREQARKQAMAGVGAELDNADNPAMSSRGLAALDGARAGQEPQAAMADGLIKGGFAERGTDGRFRLTSEGRALLNAAGRGDTQASLDAISRASDRASRNADKEARAAEREKGKQEKGGGGKKPKQDKKPAPAPKEDAGEDAPADTAEAASPRLGGGDDRRGPMKPGDKEASVEGADDTQADETAGEVGLDKEALSSLRDAADGGGADSPALRELGFTDADGDATPEGVNALDALERGDARGYRRAVRRAKAHKRREDRRQAQDEERTRARSERDAERAKRKAETEGRRRTGRGSVRENDRANQERAARDKAVSDEVSRIDAARARKGIDAMDVSAVLEDLEDLRDELMEDVLPSAIKAGRRNSGSDQSTIDRGYALAEELCDLFEALGATVEEGAEEEAAEMGTPMEGKAGDDYSHDGDAVKSIADGAIGAFAIRFGSEAEPDMSSLRDYFTKSTDFWLDAWDRRPMLFHHAMDEDTADSPRIGTWTKAEVKDEGVWLEGQLDKAHRYYGAIKELVRRGVLRLSSDSAPHLVRRATKAGGIHEVTRWPLLAASLTPTPAEPRLSAVSFKALLAELGLEGIHDNPEVQGTEGERPDGAKADQERARRLLLRTKLLTLQE